MNASDAVVEMRETGPVHARRVLLTLDVADRAGVAVLHRRALEVAAGLGLGTYRQAHLATTVSALVHEAHARGAAFGASFELDGRPPRTLSVRLVERPGTAPAASGPTGWRLRWLESADRSADRVRPLSGADGGPVGAALEFALGGDDGGALDPDRVDALIASFAPDACDDTIAGLRERNALLLASLAESEAAVAMREELLAIVSHDLRNPLGSMVTSAEALEYAEIDGEAREFVMHMSGLLLRSARQMEKLIDDLLDLASLRSGKLAVRPVPEDALDIVQECARTHASAADAAEVKLVHDGAEALGVRCDRDRTLQILSNLVGNAIKFSAPGGRVVIDVRRDGAFARFSVLDTGRGMSADEIGRMFERHWQSDGGDRRGIGLGLSIVHALVDAHDGEIDVESEPGAGTRVRVGLPLAEPGHAHAEP